MKRFAELPWKARVSVVKTTLNTVLQAVEPGDHLTTRQLADRIVKAMDPAGIVGATAKGVASILMKLAPQTDEAEKGTNALVLYGRPVHPWIWGHRDAWTVQPDEDPEPSHMGLWVDVRADLANFEVEYPDPTATVMADLLDALSASLRRSITEA